MAVETNEYSFFFAIYDETEEFRNNTKNLRGRRHLELIRNTVSEIYTDAKRQIDRDMERNLEYYALLFSVLAGSSLIEQSFEK
eukprot:Awhi_evm1s14835